MSEHSCGYECEKTECIKSQRKYLVEENDRLKSQLYDALGWLKHYERTDPPTVRDAIKTSRNSALDEAARHVSIQLEEAGEDELLIELVETVIRELKTP